MVTRFNEGVWISLLYVEPEYRRRGIATKLLDSIESEFKEKRFYLIPTPMYGSDISLQDLVALYHRRGYKESHVHKPMLVLEPRLETRKAQQ